MKGNIGTPFFSGFPVDPALDWQMSRAEKYCLIDLMNHLKPEVAIEIGTYKGGSLQVIQHFSKEVYSIDISPAPKKFLEPKFPHVHFIVGEGDKLVHDLFARIDQEGKKLDFILVDGDHTCAGVQRDLHAILSYPHKNPFVILLHDSFNPQCRKGISSIPYNRYPAVEYVELDYITGSFWHNDTYREMWGGLAMIRVNPENQQPLEIVASQGHLYRRALWGSTHLIKDRLRFLGPWKKALYRMLGKPYRTDIYDAF
jgi:hypothetical protein